MENLNRLKTMKKLRKFVKKQTFYKSIRYRWSQRTILSNIQVIDESDMNLNPPEHREMRTASKLFL